VSTPSVPLATGLPLLDVFWSMLWLFAWILWIFLLIRILTDVFRSPDLSGWGKAGWTAFIIVVPLLAVLAYLVVRGGSMHERDQRSAAAAEDSFRSYLQSVTGTSVSTAEELTKLAALRDSGVLTEAEFADQKAKLLARA
jgi:hypothetical protein